MTPYLTVTEIYASIQGESSFAGWPCVFVRLTGCPLRCRWCDTAYAFKGGQKMSLDAIVAEVASHHINLVEITGGEPLAQAETPLLIEALQAKGHQVLIETGGSEPVDKLPFDTRIIMDIKCPGSGMQEKNLWSNLDKLRPHDEIKFVLADRHDFDWAMEKVHTHKLSERFHILFSCAYGLLKPKDLAAWMVAEKVPARLQLQQHKYIWGPRVTGV